MRDPVTERMTRDAKGYGEDLVRPGATKIRQATSLLGLTTLVRAGVPDAIETLTEVQRHPDAADWVKEKATSVLQQGSIDGAFQTSLHGEDSETRVAATRHLVAQAAIDQRLDAVLALDKISKRSKDPEVVAAVRAGLEYLSKPTQRSTTPRRGKVLV